MINIWKLKGCLRIFLIVLTTAILIIIANRLMAKPIVSPEFVKVNDHSQWIYYFGKDTSKPLVLFVHGGPGTTETPFFHKYNKNLDQDYLVAFWEQRGAGKTFRNKCPDSTMNLEQIVSDCKEVTEYLLRKFNRKKLILIGHSWGTIVSMHVLDRYPHLYHCYFGIAQSSNAYEEELEIHRWLVSTATINKDKKALKKLIKQGPPIKGRITPLDQISYRVSLVNKYGGAAFYNNPKGYNELVKAVLKAPFYNIRDKLNYLRSEKYSLKLMYGDFANVNLFESIDSLKVPIVLLHGEGDYQVPIEIATSFLEHLNAPYKKMYRLENMAHGVLFEDPKKFKTIIDEEIRSLKILEG